MEIKGGEGMEEVGLEITVCPQKYDPKTTAVTMRAQAVGTAGAVTSVADAVLLVGCFCCVVFRHPLKMSE